MILNSKGRVVTDCFLYPDPFHNVDGVFQESMNEPGYLLEVDTLILQQLMMILKLHKLSAKVDIVPDKNFIHITIMMTLPHLMHGWKIFNSNTLKVLIQQLLYRMRTLSSRTTFSSINK